MKILRPEYNVECKTLSQRIYAHLIVFKTVLKMGFLKVQPTLYDQPYGKPFYYLCYPRLKFSKPP